MIPLNVLSFGCKGDAKTDNAEKLQFAIDVAKAQCQPLWMPPGVYWYSTRLYLDSVDLYGDGDESVLYALDTSNCAVFVRGFGAKVRKLKFSGIVPTERTAPWETTRVVAKDGASEWLVEGITIETASGAGIMSDVDANNGVIRANYVHDTLADSIHITGRSHHILVEGNKVRNSGDDGVAVVSYHNNNEMVHHVIVRCNDIRDNKWGRGMSVIGGTDVLHEFNFVGNNAQAAGIIYAQEDSYDTFAAYNVTCRRNTVVNCGNNDKGHWAILATASDNEPNSGITIERNVVVIDDDRSAIDVRVNNDNTVVDSNAVQINLGEAYRMAQGVTFNPYVDGPVGMG